MPKTPRPAGRRSGRPAHEPTDDTRDLVRALVARGKTVADIALTLGISAPTLRAHYRADLAAEGLQKRIDLPEFAEPAPPRAAPEGAGRTPHVPTDDLRERVEILVAGGMPAWQVAKAVGVSASTLSDHYADQLDSGRARKNAEVMVAMFKAATEAGNVSAQKAWLAQSTELDDAPPPPEKAAPLGKKAAAQVAAESAGQGTDWAGLLPH